MLAKERLLFVLNRLHIQPSVSIKALSEELGVSISTIQRDLRILEEQGKIQRERGGALNKELTETLSNLTERPVGEKELINLSAKQLVCTKAAELIKNGDCIFIDSGTTPAHLVPLLANKEIKVVTNSVYALDKLVKEYRGEVYVLGGQFNAKYDMNMGPITLEEISKFRFDHAFLGVSGIDLDSGEIFSADFAIGAIKQTVMKRSNHTYVLSDDSKYSIKALCTWANLTEFDLVFVNSFPANRKKPKNIVVCET